MPPVMWMCDDSEELGLDSLAVRNRVTTSVLLHQITPTAVEEDIEDTSCNRPQEDECISSPKLSSSLFIFNKLIEFTVITRLEIASKHNLKEPILKPFPPVRIPKCSEGMY